VVVVIPGIKYQWRINGVTNPADTLWYVILPTNATTANLTVRNSFGCSKTSANLITNKSDLILLHETARIFPNPASKQIWLDFGTSEGSLEIRVSNLKGQEVKSFIVSGGNAKVEPLEVGDLPSGLYLFKLRVGDKFRHEKIWLNLQ